MSSNTKPTVRAAKSASTAGRRRICFEIDADPGSEVCVAGSFNAWNPSSHLLKPVGEGGHFKRFVYLPPGKYEYKFVIDGSWTADPNCVSFAPNKFGSLNSLLEVEANNS